MAENMSGYLNISYNVREEDSAEESSTEITRFETLSLRVNRQITPSLGSRMELRASELVDETDETDSRSLNAQPSMDLSLERDIYSIQSGYRISDSISKTSGSSTSETFNDNTYLRLTWMPKVGLPLFLNYNLAREWSPDETNDTTIRTLQATTSYQFGAVNTSYNFHEVVEEDDSGEKKQQDHTFIGGYQREFVLIEDHLTFRPEYNFNYYLIPGGSDVVTEISLTPVQGLSGIDSTPLDDLLSDTPQLVDKNLTTGVEIGNGSVGLDQNLGFSLSAESEVGKILINLGPDFDSSLAGFFSFRAYKSDDGEVWTEISSSKEYNSLENRFEISILETAVYFKVVVEQNSGYSVLATEIGAAAPEKAVEVDYTVTTHSFSVGGEFNFSEIDAWGYSAKVDISTISPDNTETISTDNYLTLTLSAIKNMPLNISYQNTVSDTRSGSDRYTTETNRYSLNFPLQFIKSTVTTSYENTANESNVEDFSETSEEKYNVGVIVTPRSTMTHTLLFSSSEQTVDGSPSSSSESVSLLNYLKLYKTLSANINLSSSTSTDESIDEETETKEMSVALNALLTDRLTAFADYKLTSVDDGNEGTESETSASSTLIYNLSRAFRAVGKLGYTESEDSSVFEQQYDLLWSPSSKLKTDLSYTRSVQDTSSGTFISYEYSGTISWQIWQSTRVELVSNLSDDEETTVSEVGLTLYIKI